jgi:hypothetical protein
MPPLMLAAKVIPADPSYIYDRAVIMYSLRHGRPVLAEPPSKKFDKTRTGGTAPPAIATKKVSCWWSKPQSTVPPTMVFYASRRCHVWRTMRPPERPLPVAVGIANQVHTPQESTNDWPPVPSS